MAYITIIPVSEETKQLMGKFNFTQVDAIAPNIKWVNHKGVTITHHSSQIPNNIDDVVNMIYNDGINTGAFKQMEKIREEARTLIDRFITDNRILYREPVRADNNLLFNLKCVE